MLRIFALLSVLWFLAPGAFSQGPFVLTNNNSLSTFKFVLDNNPPAGGPVPRVAGQSNLWLESIATPSPQGLAVVSFDTLSPLWRVELRIDPSQDINRQYKLEVLPNDLPLNSVTVGRNAALNGGILLALWGPGFVSVANNAPTNPVELSVVAAFELKDGVIVADAGIYVVIHNESATTYRLLLSRFPSLMVENLDPDQLGTDRLALGKNGGALYGDPIEYRDSTSNKGLDFTQNPDHEYVPSQSMSDLVDYSALEPGAYSVPVCVYYDTVSKVGFYTANDDFSGYVKEIQWTRHPGNGDEIGHLRFEAVQFVPGNVFVAALYISPYLVQLGAIPDCDWVTAAQMYRKTYKSFPYYTAPIGAPSNMTVHDDMKHNPLVGLLGSGIALGVPTAGNGYTEANFNPQEAADRLSWWLNWFSPSTFPMLLLDRFAVDPPTEISLAGLYSQGALPNMQSVRQLAAAAEFLGNHVALLGMTEKLMLIQRVLPNPLNFPCTVDPNYCLTFPPPVELMNKDNRVRGPVALTPSNNEFVIRFPCSLGKGATPPADYATWISAVNVSMADQLNPQYPLTGGQAWTAPTVISGPCFATDHHHPAGYGNWMAGGWVSIINAVNNNLTPQRIFPTLVESGTAFFSQVAPICNAVSFDTSYPPEFATLVSPTDKHKDAPFWRIPMLQMVADNIRYGCSYQLSPCRLPGTDIDPTVPAQSWFFKNYPALPASLGCRSMAWRVLGHQGCVVITSMNMFDWTRVSDSGNTSGQTNVELAVTDMMTYYRSLTKFLINSSNFQTAMDYHTGTMERSPDVTISGGQQFSIKGNDMDTYLINSDPLLIPLGISLGAAWRSLLMSTSNQDLDFSKFNPATWYIDSNRAGSQFHIQQAPEYKPCWLPHGMYRHHDGSNQLAFLISNPWGAMHRDGMQTPVKEMNPFTFLFAAPQNSPTTTYSYSIAFDPKDYDGFPNTYNYVVVQYDRDGKHLSTSATAQATGASSLSSTLPPFHSEAWFFF